MTDKNDADEPLDKEISLYWRALGMFVSTFAEIEAMLFVTTAKLCDLPSDMLLSIGPNFRADGTMQVIRRVIELRSDSKEMKEQLKETLTQIGHINDMRNHLLHQMTYYEPGNFVITNSLMARNKDLVKTTPTSREILLNMIQDLGTAWGRLWWYQYQIRKPGELSDEQDERFKNSIPEVLRRAWLYKPSQPSSKDRRPR
jgi:hypothetical protein